MNAVAAALSRSTGIVAMVLAVASLVWGFAFSARETGTRFRPAWWLDLHNWLGGAALACTIVHIATVLVDRSVGVGIAEVFVPGIAATERWALAWGVVATYLFATTVLSSWPRRRFRRRTWRIVHLGSVVGVVLAVVHGLQIGTDATTLWYRAVVLTLVAIGVYLMALRVAGVWFDRRAAAGPTTHSPETTGVS